MTPEQRVGQLFLVPFQGSDAGPDSPIAALIDEFGIGGVLLDPAAGNFRNAPDAPSQIAELTNALQSRAAAAPRALPLFLAIDGQVGHSTGGVLRGGMTPLPSAMALGATWDVALAQRIGEIHGAELRAVGINLLLGPSLDVLEVPRPGSSGDLGTLSFGGDAAWVARFGKAYIEGLHRGSERRLAVAAGNFPGIGDADRSQTRELPIVDSALDAMQAVELVPYLAVVDRAERAERLADALLTTHVRYRGVQRQIDRPLSLDASGLRYLTAQLPGLAEWRESGGIMISAGLGLPAVRRYADPQLETFNVRRVVLEALLAGNDVLSLNGISEATDPEEHAAEIREAIGWLAEAYREDEGVRETVDASVLRILQLKRRLYPDGGPSLALVDAAAAAGAAGLGTDDVANVGRQALTYFAPAGAQPPGQAQSTSPQPGDRVLWVVDAREERDCPDCEPFVRLRPERFVEITLGTYGPDGRGTARLARREDVDAITFRELRGWLDARGEIPEEENSGVVPPPPPERAETIERLISDANWLIFAMRDVRASEAPGSDAIKRFLRSSLADSAGRRLLAVAFDAPYYLDTTEIGKLSAYYALYAPSEPFVDVAVRAVFGDIAAAGASPVSVPGAGYDLPARLQPAADQPVTLELVGRDPARSVPLGQDFTVRTSVIRDANGNRIPDGTPVTFRGFDRSEQVFLRDATGTTVDGVATVVLVAERTGELEVTAVLENALASAPLVVAVDEGDDGEVEGGPPRLPLPGTPIQVDWTVLLFSLTLMLLVGVVVFGADFGADRTPSRRLRLFLLSLAWGMGGYLLTVVGGLRVGELPAGTVLWPTGWHPVYQAPLLSAVFALLPLGPSLARALAGAFRRARGR